MHNAGYPNIVDDYAYTFKLLKTLPCDVFLASHGSFFSMKEKMARREKGEKTNPFIDPQGYVTALAKAEQAYRDQLQKERQAQGAK